MNKGACYNHGSYFLNTFPSTNGLICGHSDGSGVQWLYPDNTTICTSTTSPIKCNTNGNTTVLKRNNTVSFRTTDELGYTCCLPYSCSNDNTDMITANVYRKIF